MPLLLILENYDGPGWVGEAKGNRRSDRGRGQVKDVYKWGACGSWCLYFFNPLTLKTVHKRLVVVILVVGDCVFYVYTYLRSCQVLLRQISPKVSKQWAVHTQRPTISGYFRIIFPNLLDGVYLFERCTFLLRAKDAGAVQSFSIQNPSAWYICVSSRCYM